MLSTCAPLHPNCCPKLSTYSPLLSHCCLHADHLLSPVVSILSTCSPRCLHAIYAIYVFPPAFQWLSPWCPYSPPALFLFVSTTLLPRYPFTVYSAATYYSNTHMYLSIRTSFTHHSHPQ
ncbi:hypothetical protein JB92DRAFT_109256 [Gautieria morchelliformis]|nr:hypothetical protein JB92DRAFT_109256 [Gautieria morchelliformis]